MMKNCRRCGTQVIEGYRICPRCGGKDFSPVSVGPAPAPAAKMRGKFLRPAMQAALLPRWAIVAIIGGVALFFALLFTGTGRLADAAARNVSLEEERQLLSALTAEKEMRALIDAALPDDHPYVRLTRRIGRDLVRALPNPQGYEYRFFVVPAKEINAFALPGGWVLVLSGLIEAVKTPERLAAVIAHEIQHVENRHGLRQNNRALGAFVLMGILFGVTQDAGTLLSGSLLSLKYSRDFETEADIEGARLMARAGVSPKAMVSMLTLLEEVESGWTPTMLSNHPKSGARARRVAEMPETRSALPERNPGWGG